MEKLDRYPEEAWVKGVKGTKGAKGRKAGQSRPRHFDTCTGYDLRERQIHVLRVLRRAGGPISKDRIALIMGVSIRVMLSTIGPDDLDAATMYGDGVRGYVGYKGLHVLKLVRPVHNVDDGINETGWLLTALGKKAYEDSKHLRVRKPKRPT